MKLDSITLQNFKGIDNLEIKLIIRQRLFLV